MNEIFLCKYGEIALKGLNRGDFESILVKEIKNRIVPFGKFNVSKSQSTIYVVPNQNYEKEADFDGAFDQLTKIFGLSAVCRAKRVEKNMENILEEVKKYIPPLMQGKKTFRCSAKRADKRFPLTSPEISAEVGGAILEATGGKVKVSMENPEITITVEIREEFAFIHADAVKGAGGMPVGTAGRAMLLLSGGIDSPVAGYMMAKRGCKVEAVHFESFPYTSEAARDKVLELANITSEYCGPTRVNVVSVTEIQERLRDTVQEEYFTLLLRRCMMRLASRVAKSRFCDALITGESLGQVASQTMLAMNVTDPAAEMLVFRPCIGMDKEEIIAISRKIGAFETSILPYEDCCTVFTPKHPKTRPELDKVLIEEEKANLKELEDIAFENIQVYYCGDNT